MDPILEHVYADLGLHGWEMDAELYKMLVYEPGCFFRRHRDNVRIDNMFGTLVITLPTRYSGAILTVQSPTSSTEVEHHKHFSVSPTEGDGKAKTRGRTRAASHPVGVHFTAFYADCFHEVDMLTDGYRVALVYNLTAHRPARPSGEFKAHEARAAPCRVLAQPPQPVDEAAVAKIAAAMKLWESEGDSSYPDMRVANRQYADSPWGGDEIHEKPLKLVAILSHSYTPKGIMNGLVALKGRDRVVAELLCAARFCVLRKGEQSLRDLALRAMLTDDPASYQAMEPGSSEHATVQAALEDQQATAAGRDPTAEFDAYLCLCVLWDRGECTPGTAHYTTGPLIPLFKEAHKYEGGSKQPTWCAEKSKTAFDGTGMDFDMESVLEDPPFGPESDEDYDDYSYQERVFEFMSRNTPAEPGFTHHDLEILPDELLLTSDELKKEIFEGTNGFDDMESMEFLGNGCPYGGQWYSRAAIVMWPRAHRETIKAQLAEQAADVATKAAKRSRYH